MEMGLDWVEGIICMEDGSGGRDELAKAGKS